MKIKPISSISTRVVFSFSAVVFAVLFALRMYQRFSLTDPTDGFFTDKSNPTVMIFYIFSVAAVIAVAVLCKLCGDLPSGVIKNTTNPIQGVAAFLFAGALAVEAVRIFTEISSTAETNGVGFFAGAKLLGSYYYIAYFVFAVLSVIALLVSGVSFFSGKEYASKLKLLSLSPVLWAFFLTINYFKITASYLKVTELMLTIFGGAFLMLFLFQYARFLSGFGSREAAWTYLSTGITAAILLLITSVPTLILMLSGKSELVVVNCPFRLYSLCGGLFALVSVLGYRRSCQENPVPVNAFPSDDAEEADANKSDEGKMHEETGDNVED